MPFIKLSMYQLVELKKALALHEVWDLKVDIDTKTKCMTITHKTGIIEVTFLPTKDFLTYATK